MKFNLASITASAVLGLSTLTAAAAPSLLDFTVAEGSVPGALANTFVADKINGGYNEVLTINPDFSFSTTAVADFGQFFKDDGSTLVTPTQVNGLGASNYGIYAIFTSFGVPLNNPITDVAFLAGSFNLYIDPNQDTVKTLGATGSSAVTFANDSDDYLLAFSTTMVNGVALLGDPGSFDLTFTKFTLTPAGSGYFISPNPFHLTVNVDGDFDQLIPTPGNFTVVGDVSAVFVVPEPGSLALAGLGLLGVALSRRRQTKK